MSTSGSTIFKTTKGFLRNNAVELMRVMGLGPVVIVAQNQDDVDCIVNAYKINSAGTAGRAEASTTTTAVTDEHNIAPHGDAAELHFLGTIAHLPCVPKSIAIHQDSDGAIIAYDGGDGHFYTNDTDEDECGTIDYFNGAIVLSFPAGKAPGAGELDQAYLYEDDNLHSYGRKCYTYQNLSPNDVLVIGGACAHQDNQTSPVHVSSSLIHCDILVAGDASSASAL